jgi:hypothetical protein
MATKKGKEGIVKVGSDVVGEVKSFELTVTANEVDTSTLGTDWTGTDSTQKSWSGTIEMFYDPDDAGQDGVAVGEKVTLSLYYEGDTTGLNFDSGSALVTSIARSQSFDGMVEQTFSFTGDGALTTAVVA